MVSAFTVVSFEISIFRTCTSGQVDTELNSASIYAKALVLNKGAAQIKICLSLPLQAKNGENDAGGKSLVFSSSISLLILVRTYCCSPES